MGNQPNQKKQLYKDLAKGLNLVLDIRILAYDPNGGVSDPREVTKTVFVNRNPGEFEFINIYFDFNYYNWLEISWTQATDEDGDILSYDIYINDTIIEENYVIGSDGYNTNGYFSYYENFEPLITDQFMIKIVAKDNAGGTYEINKTYDFRATDIDLGSIDTPSEQLITVNGLNSEEDNRIGYNFTIAEETGYAIFSEQYYFDFILKDGNGNYINSGSRISNTSLLPGDYYLEVVDYGNNSGNFTMVFRDPSETDEDLGVLSAPYNSNVNYTLSLAEPDNKIVFDFQIESATGYSFNTSGNVNLRIYSSSGAYINEGYQNVSGAEITPGSYYVEVESYYGYSEINTTLTILLDDPSVTDVDLGVISAPVAQLIDFDTSLEIDRSIKYQFTIENEMSYTFDIINEYYDDYIYLYDSNGNYINASDYGAIEGNLTPGIYYVEVTGFSNYFGQGTLSFELN